ncbi:MAG: CotH kinase family protein [Flavobacteriales bacterium]|nr:CotH kinase family protein [Flavobacteriales bacterium]
MRYGFVGLIGATLAALLLMAFMGNGPAAPPHRKDGAFPIIVGPGAHMQPGERLLLRSSAGGSILLALGADDPMRPVGDRFELVVEPDRISAARMSAIPLSLNWKHPLLGTPVAQVFRFAELDGTGRPGPERMHTVLFEDHGGLPVMSILVPEASLFHPDSGLMVVGNGIFHAPEKVLTAEYRDPKSWKYPGNFHMRGKDWEREALIQLIDQEGKEEFQAVVGIRINGQMTRSFPQHAFRLNFDPPLASDVFGEAVGKGYDALVLRTAGNDQIKAMMRDPFQHGLIDGLPIETASARTCVVYINGAYWGVHHLRHRLDDEEIARRYGIKKKFVTILEDEARLYRGDAAEVAGFEFLAQRTARWNGKRASWRDTLEGNLDVDGFLTYMATQMILGNVDWPSQNVKFWKYTGPSKNMAPLDGRWRSIMGDTDLAFGVYADASTDMFARVKALDYVPLSQLFFGMMNDNGYKARFISIARELATGRFSAGRMSADLERFVQLMAPEMERHTARWRRPSDVEQWMKEVDVMRTFAAQREANVLKQLDAFEGS